MTLLTSESVTAGHPDKVADQISDAVLDAMLVEDPDSRVAMETMVTATQIILAGEYTTNAKVNVVPVARRVLTEIGYTAANGYSPTNTLVRVLTAPQSPEIASAVFDSEDQGAGDQGIMFGYATGHTVQGLPLPLVIARQITSDLRRAMLDGVPIGPDGKSQITVENNRRVTDVVVSTMHSPRFSLTELQEWARNELIPAAFNQVNEDGNAFTRDDNMRVLINPAGTWNHGGPAADTGLTGRKIIVDTYGGAARHGGGAFSGKDPSKVDRSGAYAARQLALSVLQEVDADECEVQLAYAIGVPEPVSILVNTYGAVSPQTEDHIARTILKNVDLTPAGIIQRLDLKTPRYETTARQGHFGHKDYPWEAPIPLFS